MTAGLTTVQPSMVRAIIDEAKAKGYRRGVIGLRGVPTDEIAAEFEHHGQTVVIRPAVSALAVHELLMNEPDGGWLAVVTDRPEADLGAGILARLVWSRLRSPYPWEALRSKFSATGVEPRLVEMPHNRDFAGAVLQASPADDLWPAAPGGILTRDHLMRCLAAEHLGLSQDAVDAVGLIRWAARPDAKARLIALRSEYPAALADRLLEWVAELAGSASGIASKLLTPGNLGDVVAVALVIDLLNSVPPNNVTHRGSVTLAAQYGVELAVGQVARAWGSAAASVIDDDLHDEAERGRAQAILRRAGEISSELDLEGLDRYSNLLPAGLAYRQNVLADAVSSMAAEPTSANLDDVQSAWASLLAHRDTYAWNGIHATLEAAVRLCRWLGTTESPANSGSDADFVELAYRHVRSWSWADAAINDAWAGVDHSKLKESLRALLDAALERRRAEERAFAKALAGITSRGAAASGAVGVSAGGGRTAWYLEHILADLVLPAAKARRTLLVVLDGMSAASANEIVEDLLGPHGWDEAGFGDRAFRAAAVAVLPSLTEVSRCSLLSGRLTRGAQKEEVTNFSKLLQSKGLTGELFHKKDVETRDVGDRVAAGVRQSLNSAHDVVALVLNTIDDALDRSDPTGTHWGADAVKNLVPILDAARLAGRDVVLTADHGHVVERRLGQQRSATTISSGRSRDGSSPVGEDEVLVEGLRVLAEGNRAVLAVDEGLRYGPLKAGYHGGASASEVIVPVIRLVGHTEQAPEGVRLLSPQAPAWWFGGLAPAQNAADEPSVWTDLASEGTLFSAVSELPSATRAGGVQVPGESVGARVVASDLYSAQKNLVGVLSVSDEQVKTFVDILSGANGGRVQAPLAAQALGVAERRLAGAFSHVAKLLNVEGYAVVRRDAATGDIKLDAALLREQFGVKP